MRAEVEPNRYVLGHSDHELERLEQQAEIFADATEDVLRRAGVGPGMRVLDVGCGAGDVTLIAARLVGPAGSVLGVDHAPEAVRTARRRAEAVGQGNVSFEQTDVTAGGGAGSFDAVVGRFILMHLADPADTVGRLKGRVRSGGVIAFIEMDIGAAVAIPEMPLFERCKGWLVDLYRKVGVEPDMGSRLYATLKQAGLAPTMTGSCRVEGGENALRYDFLTPSITTLLPGIVQFGVATAEEVGIDTLGQRIRHNVLAGDHCFVFPRVVGAWAKVS